jgi:hypothetical protein
VPDRKPAYPRNRNGSDPFALREEYEGKSITCAKVPKNWLINHFG